MINQDDVCCKDSPWEIYINVEENNQQILNTLKTKLEYTSAQLAYISTMMKSSNKIKIFEGSNKEEFDIICDTLIKDSININVKRKSLWK